MGNVGICIAFKFQHTPRLFVCVTHVHMHLLLLLSSRLGILALEEVGNNHRDGNINICSSYI